jgi:hypothetical protein
MFAQLAVDEKGAATKTLNKAQWLKQRDDQWTAILKAAGKEKATELSQDDFVKGAAAASASDPTIIGRGFNRGVAPGGATAPGGTRIGGGNRSGAPPAGAAKQ